jgi:hypothetical protein
MLWGTNWETKRLDRAAIIKQILSIKGKCKQWEGFINTQPRYADADFLKIVDRYSMWRCHQYRNRKAEGIEIPAE